MAQSAVEARTLPAGRFSGLLPRVVSALILAAIGFAAIWYGYPWTDLLVAAATVVMFREWYRLCRGVQRPLWLIGGLLYIGLAICGFLWMRHQRVWGLETALWLVFVVAATDIGAYFTGRVVGGPKLAPRISPGKTWAGLAGGTVLAVLVSGAFAACVGGDIVGVAAFAAPVAVVAQGGDLLESAAKRRFGVKDSGQILPGHGGLLDRFDGLSAATLLVAGGRLLHGGSSPWT